MIYHNVTTLAAPSVTVSGGTASWDIIENAAGYVYKINDGAEQSTTQTSVSGLVVGDRIVVRATSIQIGYVDSEWSEERTQLPMMSAPVVDTTNFTNYGIISWAAVEGADYHIYEIDGVENSHYDSIDLMLTGIEDGSTFRIRAACTTGQYDMNGEWSDYFTR